MDPLSSHYNSTLRNKYLDARCRNSLQNIDIQPKQDQIMLASRIFYAGVAFGVQGPVLIA